MENRELIEANKILQKRNVELQKEHEEIKRQLRIDEELPVSEQAKKIVFLENEIKVLREKLGQEKPETPEIKRVILHKEMAEKEVIELNKEKQEVILQKEKTEREIELAKAQKEQVLSNISLEMENGRLKIKEIESQIQEISKEKSSFISNLEAKERLLEERESHLREKIVEVDRKANDTKESQNLYNHLLNQIEIERVNLIKESKLTANKKNELLAKTEEYKNSIVLLEERAKEIEKEKEAIIKNHQELKGQEKLLQLEKDGIKNTLSTFEDRENAITKDRKKLESQQAALKTAFKEYSSLRGKVQDTKNLLTTLENQKLLSLQDIQKKKDILNKEYEKLQKRNNQAIGDISKNNEEIISLNKEKQRVLDSLRNERDLLLEKLEEIKKQGTDKLEEIKGREAGLELKQKEIEEFNKRLLIKEKECVLLKDYLVKKQQETDDARSAALSLKAQAKNNLDLAEQKLSQETARLKEIDSIKEELDKKFILLEQKTKILNNREKEIQLREQAVSQSLATFINREKSIEANREHLFSQQRQLKMAMDRIKQREAKLSG